MMVLLWLKNSLTFEREIKKYLRAVEKLKKDISFNKVEYKKVDLLNEERPLERLSVDEMFDKEGNNEETELHSHKLEL